jgi:hypothetical protein
VHDLAPSWNLADWSFVCPSCGFHRVGLPYEGLPPLYYSLQVSSLGFWAWNREHLKMLFSILRGDSVTGHPYESLAAYVRKEWLQQSGRRKIVKVIQKNWLS